MNLPYINLPQSQAPQIIGDIGDTLVHAAQRKQEREMQAAKLLMDRQQMDAAAAHMQAEEARAKAEASRQDSYAAREQHRYDQEQRQNTASALPKIHEMLARGDQGGANALAQAYGIDIQQRLPQAPPGPAPMAPQPGMVGPIPSPEERAMSFANQPGDQGQAAEQAINEDNQQRQQRDEFTRQLAEYPKRIAEHADHVESYKQAKENPAYDIKTPFGTSTFDLAQERSVQGRVGSQLKEAFGGKYGERAAALNAAGIKDPAVIAKYIEGEQKADEDRAFKEQMANQFQTTAGQKFQIGMSNAGSHAVAARASAASKDDAASARAMTTLDRAMAHAEKTVDWKGLVGMDNTMRGLMANIDSPNVLQKRDAQIQLGRLFRGTTPTEGEMHLLYNNLGGTADKWNQIVAGLESGGLSDEQTRQLKASAGTASAELEHRKGRTFKALATQFGPGSGFEELGPQINTALKARGQAMGVDVPDVYDQKTAGPGATLLGSRVKKQTAATGVNPLVAAEKFSKLTPEDKDAVKQARERLAKNPNDEIAKQVLELHGL